MPSHAIEVVGLTKSFEGFGLHDVTFSLPQGYITGLIGCNGAGKSSLIKTLVNLTHRDSGEISILGMPVEQLGRETKSRIGVVFDDDYYYSHLSGATMKRIIASFFPNWNEERFSSLVQAFDLPLRRRIGKYSRGMKTKFAVAAALAHEPDLLLMDEPTSGLDPASRRQILQILREFIQDESKSVLFSTHITTDLERIADYIVFLQAGRVTFAGRKDEMLDTYVIVKGAPELLDADVRNEFIGLRESAVGFEGLFQGRRNAKRLFADHALIERPTLEDVMVYTGKGGLG